MSVSAAESRAARSAGQVALIVLGALAELLALALLAGGGGARLGARDAARRRGLLRDRFQPHRRTLSSRTGSTWVRMVPIGFSVTVGSARCV